MQQHPSINNTNIDTLLVAADQQSEKATPPEEVQDKIHFLFNNLSAANLQEKVSTWLSNYFTWAAAWL
jgi:CCR4-NOT transcription complex subunit 1